MRETNGSPDGEALRNAGMRAPDDLGHVGDLSPWSAHLADALLMNKLLLWNQPHLLGRHALMPSETPGWEGPDHAGVDPEG